MMGNNSFFYRWKNPVLCKGMRLPGDEEVTSLEPMVARITQNLHSPSMRFLGWILLLVAMPGHSLAAPPISPAQFDPSDVYFQAYRARTAAEELEAKGDFIGALEKLKVARKLFESVRTYYPEWKPQMVTGVLEKNLESQARIAPSAMEQLQKNRSVIAELEGGVQQSGTLVDPAADLMPDTPGILEIDPLAARRLAEAEAELKRLREATQRLPSEKDSSRAESRMRDMARQRDAIQSQLQAAEANVQSLRARLATSPVESEMKALNQKIAGLEQEREAMAMALNQSRSQHTEALSRIAILQADLNVMQQKYADLNRDLKSEREVANAVVSGQRAQLRAMEKQLAEKDADLAKANTRISNLLNQLEESQAAFAQLRTERDSLLQERDQMSALLKLNEDGRIQDLIQQNMGLAKDLREANERVERLHIDNNAAKDDITDALRDLAIAKSQINKLQQEKRQQDQRLAELEKRLKDEESALASGKIAADPAEVAVLRDIIQRQLHLQKRRNEAKELLIAAAREMGRTDEKLGQALKLFEGQELQLSPEEQRLIADQNVDGEFVSPFARDRATVGRNTTELNRDIAVFERTAEKSFAAGRMLPTRELFEMIVEQHPGHVPALCKLGVVHLRLKDPSSAADTFRRAVELDSNNPYANRMLGYALMLGGDFTGAEEPIKLACELAPDDAKSHLLLGTISHTLGRSKEAESHFRAAISADPLSSEPYYNLARLHSFSKRYDQARDCYEKALERGAVPDPELEQSFQP
jgi:tetratricopeptide (TPR) repeat protein